jgi:hypothetical protein
MLSTSTKDSLNLADYYKSARVFAYIAAAAFVTGGLNQVLALVQGHDFGSLGILQVTLVALISSAIDLIRRAKTDYTR